MRENIVDMVMEMKFSINKYSQVFYRVGPGYRGLAKLMIVDLNVGFPGKDITLVLLMLSFIQLTMHQPCIELMSH
jgi:hypothetical protein